MLAVGFIVLVMVNEETKNRMKTTTKAYQAALLSRNIRHIVDAKHIVYLVKAAQSGQDKTFRWFEYRDHGTIEHSLESGDGDRALEVGDMLLSENQRSVNHRYKATDDQDRLYQVQYDAFVWASFEPVDVFKAIDCLAYQSCEHPDWESSEAFAFLSALRKRYCRRLPGYSDAAWGAPDTYQERCQKAKAAQRTAELMA